MINTKGEWIYTNAEIAYELGIAPATVNAIGRRLFGGGRIAHWTIQDVKLIAEYIKSISVEEESRRLGLLRDTINSIFGDEKLDAEDVKERVNRDLHNVR